METLEGNKLILIFMGYKESFTDSFGNPSDTPRYIGEASWSTPEMCGYNRRWNSLMPVVEKIESMNHIDKDGDWGNYAFNMHRTYTSFGYGRFRIGDLYKGENRLGHTYEAVVQFIQWYNSNKL